MALLPNFYLNPSDLPETGGGEAGYLQGKRGGAEALQAMFAKLFGSSQDQPLPGQVPPMSMPSSPGLGGPAPTVGTGGPGPMFRPLPAMSQPATAPMADYQGSPYANMGQSAAPPAGMPPPDYSGSPYADMGGGTAMSPATQPTAGVLSPVPPAAPGAGGGVLGPQGGGGFLSRLGQGLADNSNTLLAFGGGTLRGGIGLGAQEASKVGLAEQNQVQQLKLQRQAQEGAYNAVISAGGTKAMALAARDNPQVLHAISAQLFAKPTWGVIGHDLANNPQMGWIDTNKQTINGKPMGQQGTGGTGFPTDAQGQPLLGEDLLAHVKKTDPMASSMVEAIGRGDASVTGRNLQKYLPLAEAIYPDLRQFNYDARKKTALDFAPGGKSAANVKSLETVGGHLEKMINIFSDRLNNTQSPDYNAIKNWFAERVGQGQVGAFNTLANGVSNELGTVFRSHGMSDAEVKSWRDRISASSSPEQFQDNMSALLDMLKTRKEAIADQYKALGKYPEENFSKLNSATARIEKMFERPGPAATPTAAAPAAKTELPRVSSPADAAKLPKGTRFLDPQGNERVVP